MDGFREEKEMKKVYKKPVLYVEKFTVDKNFAYSCGAEPGTSSFGSPSTCAYDNLFAIENVCTLLIPEGTKVDEDCYGYFNNVQPFSS